MDYQQEIIAISRAPCPIGRVEKFWNVRSVCCCSGLRFAFHCFCFPRHIFPPYLWKCLLVLIFWSLDIFYSWTNPSIHDMCPVFQCVVRQVLPSLYDEDASVADLPSTNLGQFEAVREMLLVLLTAGKSRARESNFILFFHFFVLISTCLTLLCKYNIHRVTCIASVYERMSFCS